MTNQYDTIVIGAGHNRGAKSPLLST